MCDAGSTVAKVLTSVEGGRRMEAQDFTFDHVFSPLATQVCVWRWVMQGSF